MIVCAGICLHVIQVPFILKYTMCTCTCLYTSAFLNSLLGNINSNIKHCQCVCEIAAFCRCLRDALIFMSIAFDNSGAPLIRTPVIRTPVAVPSTMLVYLLTPEMKPPLKQDTFVPQVCLN